MSVPARLGRFVLGRKLGGGGQGSVYEALQPMPLGGVRRIALKCVEHGAPLLREAEMGSLLRHPNLVDVYEVGQHEGVWYCAMELCEGGSLALRPPLPLRAVVEIGLSVCAALGYAGEELGLVHLDLKPSNLLLAGGVVKVADLGISIARGFSSDGTIRGTPRYMAPEQRLGRAVDTRTDIYALGIVLEELYAGGPVEAITVDTPGAEVSLTAARPSGPLAEILDRCTASDPADRIESMAALAALLGEIELSGPSLAEIFPPRGEAEPAPTLFGRDHELKLAEEMLSEPGIATICGPAGIGKTRLASEIARRYTRGAVFRVDLGEAYGRGELLQRVSFALSAPLPRRGDPVCRLGEALAARRSPLLVLDDFEGLASEAHVAAALAEQAPEARILVTSRSALDLPSARRIDLPPLRVEDAVALLTERAARRGVDVRGDQTIAEIAARLDGIPLALSLAAGRLGVLSTVDLLARMDLSMLRSGEIGASARRATLRGALDGSWELLSAEERAAFARLSVFRGGFRVDDALAVLGPSAPGAIESLRAISLVSTRGSADRFDLLEPVREYASARLEPQARAEAYARHAERFARHGEGDALVALRGPGRAALLAAIALDLANLAAAVERSADSGDGARAARAALGASACLWEHGPIEDGIALLSLALAVAPPALAVDLLVQRAALQIDAGSLDLAERDLDEAERIGVSPLSAVLIALRRGDIWLERGAPERAAQLCQQALSLCAREGSPSGRARLNLGAVQLMLGEPGAEQTLLLAAEELRRAGDSNEALARMNLGIALRRAGRLPEARATLRAALSLRERSGERSAVAIVRANLAVLDATEGDLAGARAHLTEAIAVFSACGMRAQQAEQLANLASLMLESGDRGAARRLCEEGLSIAPVDRRRVESRLHLLLGRALEGSRAQEALAEALAGFRAARDPRGELLSLVELAKRELLEGEPQRALRRLAEAGEPQGAEGVALLRAVRGEALAQLGDPSARADLDAALEAARTLGHSPLAVVLSIRARALSDLGALAEAEGMLASGAIRVGSPAHGELERSRAAIP